MICDTSGLLAHFDPDDRDHPAAVQVLSAARPPLVVSPFVIAELDYLLRKKVGAHDARVVFDELVAGSFELAPFDLSDLRRALEIDRRYADLDLGSTDASLVMLAARYDTRDIFTLDHRHFRQLVPLQGGRFRLLPVDS